jgi:hypothetical protein
MRSVGDELPLSFEYRGEAISHVVEGVSDLSMLRRALRLRAGFEVPGLHAPGSFGKPLKRARECVGEHPREAEAERESKEPDPDQPEDVAPHSLVDGVDALGYPHRADAPVALHDRDRRVEQRLAEGLAETAALCDPPSDERSLDLGPVSVRAGCQPGRIGQQPSGRVDDDDAASELPARIRSDAAQGCPVVALPRRAGRDELGLRSSLRLDLRVHPARDVEDQRNLQCHDHEHEHIREGGQQPAAE